jgi:hypothetical protein
VNITERDGNITLLDTTFDSPGTITESRPIPNGTETDSATWVIEWSASIGGQSVSGSEVVGPNTLGVRIPEMSQGVLNLISVLVVLMVGGLFSAANVSVGGIITALVAGGLFFVGAMPGAVSGLLVATALVIAIIAYARTNQEISPQ